MDGDSLLAFVRYHAWANDKILTTTAGLSDEELRRPDILDHGSRVPFPVIDEQASINPQAPSFISLRVKLVQA